MPKTKTPTSIIQDNSSEANPHGQPKYFKVFQRFHACIFNLAASITTGKKILSFSCIYLYMLIPWLNQDLYCVEKIYIKDIICFIIICNFYSGFILADDNNDF